MKIALFGASGTIGQRILREALQRGHAVTAVVRDPFRVIEKHPHLHAAAGNVLHPQSVAAVVGGHDAVVSAFGPGGDQPARAVVDAAHSLIAGLIAAGVKRLVVVGGAGSLEVAPGVQLVDAPDFPPAWKGPALAHRAATPVSAPGAACYRDVTSPAAVAVGRPGFPAGEFHQIQEMRGSNRARAGSSTIEGNRHGNERGDMTTGRTSEVIRRLGRTAFLREWAGLTDGQLLDCYIRRRM